MQMIDGNLAVNSRTAEGGVSARVYDGGYWGFASAPATDAATARARRRQGAAEREGDVALRRRQGARSTCPAAATAASTRSQAARAADAGRLRRSHSPRCTRGARSATRRSSRRAFVLQRRAPRQAACAPAHGSDVLNSIAARRRSASRWSPTTSTARRSSCTRRCLGKGSLADLDLSIDALAPLLDALHEHLQAKRHAVPARGGQHTVVLAPELAGILAHEAMGHPCEADLVLGGAVTADLVGQQIASELVTMIDIAHTFERRGGDVPVYADDEGTPARDAVLIDTRPPHRVHARAARRRRGSASPPTGNARAYGPNDEPLVRMRNTVILPGTSKLDEMIAGVDDGYLLMKTGNGQADSTTEFMFGISLGYEIKGGKIGRAIRDTTRVGLGDQGAGRASTQCPTTCTGPARGYCGKKQPMVVSMGGPASAHPRAPGRRMMDTAPAGHRRTRARADARAGLRRCAGQRQRARCRTRSTSRTTSRACCAAPRRSRCRCSASSTAARRARR